MFSFIVARYPCPQKVTVPCTCTEDMLGEVSLTIQSKQVKFGAGYEEA